MMGQTISHYKILEKLGEGGMGVVYKAEDTKLDRLVALKFLPRHFSDDEESRKRFIHEAKTASSLDHPNICNIHEIDETDDGQTFIVMAVYDGISLSRRIERGPLTIEETSDYAIQIADGLQAAHQKGIIHRDMKSSNIMLTEKGRAVIMDFRLARSTKVTKLTKTGTTLGTVPYMSPEQVRGEDVDHRTDIWSFGVMFFEMLSGQLPFRGEHEPSVMYSILNARHKSLNEPRPGVPPELITIVDKCLEKNKASRYDSVERITEQLRALKAVPSAGEQFTFSTLFHFIKRPIIALPLFVSLVGLGFLLYFATDI